MEGKAVCKSNKITRTPGASNIGGSDTKGKQVGTGNLQKVKTNKETAIGGIFWSGSTSEGSIKEGHSDQCSLTTKGVRPRSGRGEMRRVNSGVGQDNEDDPVRETCQTVGIGGRLRNRAP